MNVQPNVITYGSVMDAHARQGHVSGAKEVFEMMKSKGTLIFLIELMSGNKLLWIEAFATVNKNTT